jgi:hypothetical protein
MSYADHMIEKARTTLAEAEEAGDRSKIREAKTAISRWQHIRAVVDEAPEFTPELKAQLRVLLRPGPVPVMPTQSRRIPPRPPKRQGAKQPTADVAVGVP